MEGVFKIKVHQASRLRVSESGDVWGPRKKLKPWIQDGYRFVKTLFPSRKSWKVSRLVAETFIPNPKNKPEVNHKNGVKSDDNKKNLEWSTRSENQIHAFKNGLQKPNKGERAGGCKLKATDVIEIRRLYKSGVQQLELAEMKSVSRENISAIVTNKSWRHI